MQHRPQRSLSSWKLSLLYSHGCSAFCFKSTTLLFHGKEPPCIKQNEQSSSSENPRAPENCTQKPLLQLSHSCTPFPAQSAPHPSSSSLDMLVPCLGSPHPRPADHLCWAVLCLVTRSCPALCDPMDCSPLGSSVHGILQARILEWVGMPSFRGSSQPRDQTQVSHIAGGFLTISSLKLHLKSHSWGSQSPPGSPRHSLN